MRICLKWLCMLLCLTLLPCAACAQSVAAQKGSLTLSLTVDGKGLAGAAFDIYRVAAMTQDMRFELLDGYDAGDVDVNHIDSAEKWASLAEVLADQAGTPAATLTIAESGRASLSNAQTGLYLVVGRKTEIGGWTYDFAPFLMSLPGSDDEGWKYDVQAEVKHERVPATCDVEVVKVWKDEGNTKKRPASLAVELYCDGEKAYTAELNADNNWSYVWTGLASAHEWTVLESEVPDGYKAAYSTQNGALIITNTLIQKPSESLDIPQTGLTWWPVPVMGIVGAVLFMIGWAMRRKERNEHA